MTTRQSTYLASLAIHITGFSQQTLALNSSGADTSALAAGLYDITCSSDCFIKVHATNAADVTTSTGYPLKANTIITVYIPDQHVLGGVVASGTPNLVYHRVG